MSTRSIEWGLGNEEAPAVKSETEDTLEEEHAPLNKRPRQSMGMGVFSVAPGEYNPLDEPSPLGLRLKKSPSLLELIQMRLSKGTSADIGNESHDKPNVKVGVSGGDKLKASNFPASVLRIGNWEYKSRYEGDLVAKCYFAKRKLVWEVLDGDLKNKIEIQWSDIMALKTSYPVNGPGTLDVVLLRQPLFYKETNPQPRKHTLWQPTSDFTGGQASIHRRHYLECPQGLLGRHFEKLVQSDPHMKFLSQQGEITLDSPYFNPKTQVLDEKNASNDECNSNRDRSPPLFSLPDCGSLLQAQSSSSKNDAQTAVSSADSLVHEVSSSTNDGWEPATLEGMTENGIEAPGLHTSMSITDLLSHLENRVSEQGSSSNPNLSNEECDSLKILEDINRCLFSDFHNMQDLDNKSLMSRVNSLCCLLQKDTTPGFPNAPDSGSTLPSSEDKVAKDEKCSVFELGSDTGLDDLTSSSISRQDSIGDLLLNLPRIASVPQFFLNMTEDFENQGR